jgi:quercetin dioxygenase-like cupin family protein
MSLICRYLFPAVLLTMPMIEVAAEEPVMPPKQTLLEKSLELSSNKIDARVFRIVLPKGFRTPQHVHDGPGPRYVVKGRVKIEEAGKTQEYGPGQVFWETGEVMTAGNVSEGEAELVIFEIAPQQHPTIAPINP